METGNGHSPHPHQHAPPGRGREMLLLVLFTLFGGGSFILFLIYATGGFFASFLGITVGLGLFGWFHYLLWGRRFDQATRVEREFLAAQDEQEAAERDQATFGRRF